MFVLKLDFDFGLSDKQNPEKATPQQIVFNWVRYAVGQKHKDGLQGGMLRTWGRLQRKFEKAVADKDSSLEIEDAEKDLIQKAFNDGEKVKFPIDAAKVVMVIQDEIDSLKEKETA